jgi:hypothetical protein
LSSSNINNFFNSEKSYEIIKILSRHKEYIQDSAEYLKQELDKIGFIENSNLTNILELLK